MTITELIVCLFILYLFWAINVYDPLLEIRKEAGDERYYNKIWIGVDTENYTYHKRSSYDLKDIILKNQILKINSYIDKWNSQSPIKVTKIQYDATEEEMLKMLNVFLEVSRQQPSR